MPGRSIAEDRFQKAVVDWLRLVRPLVRLDCIWFHPPNGGARDERTDALMKAILVFVGRGGRTLFIELKTTTGRQSRSHREIEERCRDLEVPYHLCRDLEAVQHTLETWLTELKRKA